MSLLKLIVRALICPSASVVSKRLSRCHYRGSTAQPLFQSFLARVVKWSWILILFFNRKLFYCWSLCSASPHCRSYQLWGLITVLLTGFQEDQDAVLAYLMIGLLAKSFRFSMMSLDFFWTQCRHFLLSFLPLLLVKNHKLKAAVAMDGNKLTLFEQPSPNLILLLPLLTESNRELWLPVKPKSGNVF